MSKGKVLVIGSNATRIETTDGRSGATGQYLNETVVPMLALIAAGHEVVLATPNGSKPQSTRPPTAPTISAAMLPPMKTPSGSGRKIRR